MRPTTVKLLIFTVVMAVIFAGLAIVFSQVRFSSSNGFHATFSDVSGLKSGDKVRIAGVPVGSVTGVSIGDSNQAEVEFDVDTKYSLMKSTKATVRYENLVGRSLHGTARGRRFHRDASVGWIHSGRSDVARSRSGSAARRIQAAASFARPAAGQRPLRGTAAGTPGPGRNAGFVAGKHQFVHQHVGGPRPS